MPFQPNNTHGKTSKRGKGKKTYIAEARTNLEKAGIDPFAITASLLNDLSNKKDRSIKELELIANLVKSLYPYDSLTKSETMQLNDIKDDIQKLKNEDKNNPIFVGDANNLLEHLKNKNT